MNEGGSHWSLMVFAQHLQRFFYFDSMGKYNFAHAQIIASKTARFLRVETEILIQTVQVPQQSNSVDCGIFTLIFTDILVQKIKLCTFDLLDGSESRLLIDLRTSEILTKRAQLKFFGIITTDNYELTEFY